MIKIVTDSTVYLKKTDAEKMGVQIVPAVFIVDGTNYAEGYSDCNEDYIELLVKSKQTSTSHANNEAYAQVFKNIISSGDKVCCITMSSRLSGAYSSATVASKKFNKDDIMVFDSQQIAVGLQLLVEKAAVYVNKPDMDFVRLNTLLEQDRDKISTVFTVMDITALRKSGRVGFVREGIGTILNLRPVLYLKEGAVLAGGTVQGDNKIISKITGMVTANIKKVIISSLKNPQLASSLYYIIKKKFPKLDIQFQKFGPVLGVHIGEGAVGLAMTK